MLVGAAQISRVLQDRIGFPKGEIAVQRRRHGPVGIDRKKFGLLVSAGEIVDVLKLEGQPNQVQSCKYLAAVDCTWIEIHLQHDRPSRGLNFSSRAMLTILRPA